jgi:hypothetical protein
MIMMNRTNPETVLADWTELNSEPNNSPIDKLKQAPKNTYNYTSGTSPEKPP